MGFIWLDPEKYPDCQRTFTTIFAPRGGFGYHAAEFRRAYAFEKPVKRVSLEVSADTRYSLWLNGEYLVSGPPAEGGDYGITEPMAKHYANSLELIGEKLSGLDFFARVWLSPVVMTDYSQGHGMFILRADVEYADGSRETFETDETWLARLDPTYVGPCELNLTIPKPDWSRAAATEPIWNLVPAPIPNLAEKFLRGADDFTVPAGGEATVRASFLMIYAGYVTFRADCGGEIEAEIETFELPSFKTGSERVRASGSFDYRGARMQSVGEYTLRVVNRGDKTASIRDIGLVAVNYPVTTSGGFDCSDALLNKIYGIGRHTLMICRQSLHLDSPTHQETLGCTGDYAIEALMTYFTFGDPRLVRLDLVRTADRLVQSGGVMFHTSYSLIWVRMLWDYYVFTDDSAVFAECADALRVLLARFAGYCDGTGIIASPPNYMFVDWGEIDGYSLHHPPQALGQTCLNAFYYDALLRAADIYRVFGDDRSADDCASRAALLRGSFRRFYDAERGLYFEGGADDYEPNEWLPPNTKKRYYLRHSNALACLFGLADDPRAIMEKIETEDFPFEMQPYFTHYVLEALFKLDMFEEYGFDEIRKWQSSVEECDKGMKEGWGKFEGDYSHAWGASPTYHLPRALLGFEMLSPGFRAVRLRPRLMGLKRADVSVPTPYGMIVCKMREGEKPVVTVPDGIRAEIV